MNIYEILSSKPHNPHYLNRYIRFIEGCQAKNTDYDGAVERHYICPKAKDMFPEYGKLSIYKWNRAILTPRQHFIAHIMLWKAYPESKSQSYALWCMSNYEKNNIDSKTYSILKEQHSKNMTLYNMNRIEEGTNQISKLAKKRVEDGTHHFLGPEVNRRRLENGTHSFLNPENQRKALINGTHNFLGGEINRRRVKEGTHPFIDSDFQRKNALKRVEDGTHHFLGGDLQRKRIEEGSHNLLNSVTCFDKNGICVQVPREIYHKQEGDAEKREYVHVRSKEGKRRKNAAQQE